jgi:hypothetical protein
VDDRFGVVSGHSYRDKEMEEALVALISSLSTASDMAVMLSQADP